jgi:predicted DNA-binding protein YlxM (UPF0122 family)
MNVDREKIIVLYEIYKELLSEKEKSYFEYYFYEDYSLNEIAEINKVSRAYSSKYLNSIINKLLNYEELLKINDRNNKISKLLDDITDEKIKNKIEDLL